jgi:ribosomal protein S18 acetylase RimI-like enzyme
MNQFMDLAPMAAVLLRLRSIRLTDMELVHAIYASTRTEEMALLPWGEEEKNDFLRMQSLAQHSHYRAHYPKARFALVLRGDEPLGRLYVDRAPGEFRLMDISLLPHCRGLGIGTRLLSQLVGEANAAQARLSAHVAPENPARRWYARLGFREVKHLGTHISIVREAKPLQLAATATIAGECLYPCSTLLTEYLHV